MRVVIKNGWHGYDWECAWLGDDVFSVICLNPSIVDDIDQTTWPTDEQVSVSAGRPVRWLDAGDSNRGVEGLFRVDE